MKRRRCVILSAAILAMSALYGCHRSVFPIDGGTGTNDVRTFTSDFLRQIVAAIVL